MTVTHKPSSASILGCILLLFCGVFQGINAALAPADLYSLQQDGNVIYLNEQNFHELLSGPRPYYVSVLFTATNKDINCVQCQKFDPIYKRVASSFYGSNPGTHSAFFFIAEFIDNKQIYNELKMTQVPMLWVYPPSNLPNYNVTSPHYPYSIGDAAVNDVLDFANFISQIVGTSILVNAEFEPTTFLTYFFVTFFGVLILKKKIISKMNKQSIFKYASVITIAVLSSGYMFTVIRGIPFIAKNDKNEIMYFSGELHWQFGLEVFSISSIYLVLTGLIACLVIFIPKVEDDKRRNVLVICTCVGIFYVYNYLTGIFLIKDPSYPYRLTKYF